MPDDQPPQKLKTFGEPWIPPTFRRVCIDPIQDLIATCEAMPEFSIDHPERYADLLCAKEAISEQGFDVATEPPAGTIPWDDTPPEARTDAR